MSNITTANNGGMPQQKISGVPARQGAIIAGENNADQQIRLMGTKGGKRKKTKRRNRKNIKKTKRMRGGSPAPISPPIVQNTMSSPDTKAGQQRSYNELAELSGSVIENSKYDNAKVGGKKRIKNKKTKKHSKRRKYH